MTSAADSRGQDVEVYRKNLVDVWQELAVTKIFELSLAVEITCWLVIANVHFFVSV